MKEGEALVDRGLEANYLAQIQSDQLLRVRRKIHSADGALHYLQANARVSFISAGFLYAFHIHECADLSRVRGRSRGEVGVERGRNRERGREREPRGRDSLTEMHSHNKVTQSHSIFNSNKRYI